MKHDNEESINLSYNDNLTCLYCDCNYWHKAKHIRYFKNPFQTNLAQEVHKI